MSNVTQEDLSSAIADIKVHVPDKSESRKNQIYYEVRLHGASGAAYKNMSNYSYLYDILVRKYRGLNKFARINLNKKSKGRTAYLLEMAIEHGRNEAALLLLKLGADPKTFQCNAPLKMILRRENDTRLLYFMIKAGAKTAGCEERLLTSAMENNDINFLRYLATEKQLDIKSFKGSKSSFRYAQTKMLEFLMETGFKFDLTDGRILKEALEYSPNKSLVYERFCFWLEKGASFGDEGINVLKRGIEKNNLKVVKKILDIQNFSNNDLANIFFKQKSPNILLAKPENITQGKDSAWFSDVINHHIAFGNAPMLKALIKDVPSFKPHMKMTEMLILSYKKVKNTNPENVRAVLWECGDYDAKALMNTAVENNMWSLMQDIWQKYPDIDFSETDQKALATAVHKGSTGLIDKILERDVTVTAEMLQDTMELQNKNVIHRLVCQEPYVEKSGEFKQAYRDQDKRAFEKLLSQYVDHDDYAWEALSENVIVHHQGEESERTKLKTIFNFAVDTVTTVVHDKENDHLPPAATSLSFMQISNDDEIQRAHEKLKKFGKRPPENFETGAMGLGRRKTVVKLSK